MQTINPATGKKIKTYPEYSLKKLEDICKESQKAFGTWRALTFSERSVFMKRAAKILTDNKEKYARLMANEMGKPFAQGQGEIEKCAWVCEFYAEEAEHYLFPEMVETDASKSFIIYEPLGAILAVMPWNFPFWQVFRAAAPTLMAGNTMILKHASNVCGCALAIEEIFKEAGFPRGVFRTALISNKKVENLIAHPFVRAVTLTGSTQAGKIIASQAGALIKKTVLELGGNDPYIVLDDADLEKAADICAASRLINAGQSCVAAKRFIVVDSVFEEFLDKFTQRMQKERMGPPLEEGVTLGPLARHDLRDQLHIQVQKSVKKGARLLIGGKIPDSPGAFYPPTILMHVKAGMPAYHEELFGPVAVMFKVKDEKEAFKLANDTPFGLGAAIFTRDTTRGEYSAAHQLQAGCCFINTSVKSDPRLPFGGIKESGYGRELSGAGIREFVNVKTVYIQ